jgi:hypothetical protein
MNALFVANHVFLQSDNLVSPLPRSMLETSWTTSMTALRSGLSLKCWGFTPVYGHDLLIRDFADWKIKMF